MDQAVIYELHVGTFTHEGTFDAILPHLDALVELGVTMVELMPVAQFPGERNWGYDGAYPFAVQHSYGGRDGLRRLVDGCHVLGLAVCLDVVHNHFGPEGNPTNAFGPYVTDRYRTPWGPAVNFDGDGSDEVRRFFGDSAMEWFRTFHVDALRLDAVHGIVDTTARPYLQELVESTRRLSAELARELLVIAESDLGDPRIVRPAAEGGFGQDAQWADDLHHALHTAITGESTGYYADFGGLRDVATAFTDGFVYQGQYSKARGRRHGAPTTGIPAERFVVFAQNHDQVGNRRLGDRLSTLVDLERLKLAAGVVLLSPFVPLLFMGEEYGETAPFLYFVSHSDPEMVDAVRRGRSAEFAAFGWEGEVPDPQDPVTFERSRLQHELPAHGWHAALRNYHRRLLELRRTVPALATGRRKEVEACVEDERLLRVVRRCGNEAVTILANASDEEIRDGRVDRPGRVLVDSAERRWAGPGRLDAEQPDGPWVALRPWSLVVVALSPTGGTRP
jgi:maltooligosyltrehalose trehalohydrolase